MKITIVSFLCCVIVMASPSAIAEAPIAQPPSQVKLPSFTPVPPQSYSIETDSVTLSEVGIVTSQDCKPEQDAWVQASLEDARYRNRSNNNNYFSTNAEDKYQYLRDLYFKDEGQPRYIVRSRQLSRSQLRKNLQYFEERSSQTVPQCTEINSCIEAISLRGSRLERCVWKSALSRGGELEQKRGPASSAEPAVASNHRELYQRCTSDAANKELQAIDQRLGDFRESPAGQQTGTVTPSLQAVMWGTSKQAEVIKKYCPDSPGFKARLAELNASYQKALEACRQINSNPDQYCIPALPDNVGYQNEAPDAPVPNMNFSTGELASTAPTPSAISNPDDENTAGPTNKKYSKNTKKEKSASSQTAQNKKQKPHGPINASSCISEKNSRMVNICDFDVEVAFCVENPQQTKNFFDSSDAFKCPNGGLSTVPAGQSEPNILHGQVQWFACSTVDTATMQTRYEAGSGYKGKCY